jgi:RNA polymerase sigma-70 factor (ECF subfamily)
MRSINYDWMVVRNESETPTMMSSAGHAGPEPATIDAEFAAAIDGDPSARWRALEACRDYLRLVVQKNRWSRERGQQATSDMVQNTLLDGWRGFGHFEGRSPGQLRAWLKAIVVHASLNARRRPREAHIGFGGAAGDVPGTTTSPSQAAQRNASREALGAALGGLSERHRTVIHLRIWDQYSFAQIGTRLGISEDAARMLFARALAKLQESMRPGHDPG